MQRLALAILLVPTLASAKVLNVEFKFTPFTGDPKADHVETVAGKAAVFLNRVPIVEQEVRKQEVPVLFEEREVAAAVWIPAASLGAAVRTGKNTLRIEFTPTDPKTAYRAQLRWATVTDEVREEGDVGQHRSTNQTGEGVEDKKATGPVSLEREFDGDFATDRPWHHQPPVTALSDEDRQRLAALVEERTKWFAPDFAGIYRALEGREGLEVESVRKAKCLDAAYAAGVRLAPPPAADLDFVLTGGPEIVVRRKRGPLFDPDRKAFEKIKDDETQMCAGMALSVVYPPRLVAVRGASGAWEIAY
jgi:hypothetical protein